MTERKGIYLPRQDYKLKYWDQKKNEPIRDELKMNLEKQFELQTKKVADDEIDKQKSQYKNSELNSAWES